MTTTDPVVARECRFAIHIPKKHHSVPDLHMVKEVCHTESGKLIPNIRFIKNYTRPFYITKPSKRVHKDKKEKEYLDNLLRTDCTQSDLRDKVAKALDKSWSKDSMKFLAESPYLYGTDISSTALIKHDYRTKWPNVSTAYTVSVFDIESDVVHGHEEVLMCSLVMATPNGGFKVFTSVVESFIGGIGDLQNAIDAAAKKYLSEHLDTSKIDREVVVCKNDLEAIKLCMDKAHQWKPDFLAIWNMDFDIPKVLSTLKKYDVDPEDVLCDPKIPKDYRVCRYKQGMKKKSTAAGKQIPINMAAQWHTLFCTSSFYVIDAMCAYKQLRFGEAEEPSYSLGAILTKKLGKRKLKFKEADGYIDKAWHAFMQTYYKVEYLIYNWFDCISVLLLDDSTKDLSLTLPEYSGITDFWDFRSQPKRIADALHIFRLSRGEVMSTVFTARDEPLELSPSEGEDGTEPEEDGGDELEFELPVNERDGVLPLSGWVITLPAHMTADNGLRCIKEDSNMRTNLRAFVYDIDAVSAYPKSIECLNVSKSTTVREVIGMDGVDEHTFRMQNINLMGGRINGLEYAQTMFGLPKPGELLAAYVASKM